MCKCFILLQLSDWKKKVFSGNICSVICACEKAAPCCSNVTLLPSTAQQASTQSYWQAFVAANTTHFCKLVLHPSLLFCELTHEYCVLCFQLLWLLMHLQLAFACIQWVIHTNTLLYESTHVPVWKKSSKQIDLSFPSPYVSNNMSSIVPFGRVPVPRLPVTWPPSVSGCVWCSECK